MKLFRWTLLLGVAVFLGACGGNTKTSATVVLEAPAEVAKDTVVNLKATVTGATATTVDFVIKDGAVVKEGVTANADGSFSAVSAPIAAATTFVAIAKDASGEIGRSEAKEVKISVAATKPVATAKSVTTLVGVNVIGGTPTNIPAGPATDGASVGKLAVPAGATAQLVAASAVNGAATVAPDGSFSFEPVAAGDASFKYEVVLAGVKSDPATISIAVKALPDNTKIVTDIAQLLTETSAASTTQTIILGGSITCLSDNDTTASNGEYCFELKPNQRLVGSGVIGTGTDSVTLTNPNAKLIVNLTNAGNAITGIKLAKGVTVEGLEISGTPGQLYTAIRGIDSDFVASTDADLVTVKNVKIIGPTLNNPIGFTLTAQDATYNLLLDGLVVEKATKTSGFPAFKNLTIRNSTFNLEVPTGNGIFLQSEGTSTVTFENVTVNSSIAAGTLSAINFTQADGDEVMTISVKDTTVTFTDDGDTATPFELGDVTAFNFTFGFNPLANPANPLPTPTSVAMDILTAQSTGNTTNATSEVKYEVTEAGSNPTDPDVVIDGYIEGTPASVFVTR